MVKILVIENDLDTLESLRQYFKDTKFKILRLDFDEDVLDFLEDNNVDVIIMDLIFEDDLETALLLCKEIRKITQTPIIATSKSDDVGNKVRSFEEGVDDYLTKPYNLNELNARIKALLRRFQTREMTFGYLQIDPKKRIAKLHDKQLELTNTEFDILLFLIENRMQPISRDRIAHTINAIHEDTGLRSIDTHIRNLRNKLGDSAREPKYIQSVWGIGYKFCV